MGINSASPYLKYFEGASIMIKLLFHAINNQHPVSMIFISFQIIDRNPSSPRKKCIQYNMLWKTTGNSFFFLLYFHQFYLLSLYFSSGLEVIITFFSISDYPFVIKSILKYFYLYQGQECNYLLIICGKQEILQTLTVLLSLPTSQFWLI